jgi:hypothetical protein
MFFSPLTLDLLHIHQITQENQQVSLSKLFCWFSIPSIVIWKISKLLSSSTL